MSSHSIEAVHRVQYHTRLQHRSTTSGFSRVPFDIWRIIFLEYQGSVQPEAMFKVAVVLSSVCKSWRATTAMIMRLWCTLHINLALEFHYQRIILQLCHVRDDINSMIDVVFVGLSANSAAKEELRRATQALFPLLLHNSQWRTFVASTYYFHTLNTLFRPLHKMGYTTDLQMSAECIDFNEGHQEVPKLALCSMQLTMYANNLCISLLQAASDSLRVLYLKTSWLTYDDVTAHNVLAQLSSAKRLEHLTIHGKLPSQIEPSSQNFPFSDDWSPQKYHNLSTLKSLTFIRTPCLDIYTFIALIKAPELQKMTISKLHACNSSFYRALDALQDAVRFPAIHALNFGNLSYWMHNHDVAPSLLRAIPYCTHLEITGDDYNALPAMILHILTTGDEDPEHDLVDNISPDDIQDYICSDDDDEDNDTSGSDFDGFFDDHEDEDDYEDGDEDDDEDEDDGNDDNDDIEDAANLDTEFPDGTVPEKRGLFCPGLTVLKVHTKETKNWSFKLLRKVIATRRGTINELDLACMQPLSLNNAVWFSQHVPVFRSKCLKE